MTGVIRTLSRLTAAGTLALVAACNSTPPDTGAQVQAANAAYLAQDFTCKRAGAVTADLSAIIAHPERFMEKCVRVKAFSTGIFLFDDASQLRTIIPGKYLITYLKDKNTELRLRLGPSFAIEIGRVRSCAERLKLAQDAETVRAKQAGETPHKVTLRLRCSDGDVGLFVSEVQIIPTAMD